MTAPQASQPRFLRACILIAALLLAACASQQPKPEPANPSGNTSQPPAKPGRKPWKPVGPYTPGGLYAPGVADGAPDVPPDIANLPEPVPHAEPLAHYGNRSPYAVLGKTYVVLPSAAGYIERGMASWYGTKFDGRVTSSLEPYDLSQFTAAHRTLPLPSFARVTNLENGRSVIVRINDRGPFHEGRLIDLSYAAAIKLGVNVHGTAMVEVRGIDTGQPLDSSLPDATAAKPVPKRAIVATPRPVAPRPVVPKSVPIVKPVLPAAVAAASHDAPKLAIAPKPSPDTSPPSTAVASTNDTAVAPDGSVQHPLAAVPMTAADTAIPAPTFPLPDSTPAAPPLAAPLPVAAPEAAVSAIRPATPTPTPISTTPLAAAAATAIPVASLVPPPPVIPASVPGVVPGVVASIAPPPGPLIGHPTIDPSTQGFLQIASYGDRSNAEHMLQRLQQAGVGNAELVSVQVANQTLWRVHIGPMRADEADRVAARLDDLGFGTPPFFKE